MAGGDWSLESRRCCCLKSGSHGGRGKRWLFRFCDAICWNLDGWEKESKDLVTWGFRFVPVLYCVKLWIVKCERLKKDKERWCCRVVHLRVTVCTVIVNRLAGHCLTRGDEENSGTPFLFCDRRVKSGVKSRFCTISPDFNDFTRFWPDFTYFRVYWTI